MTKFTVYSLTTGAILRTGTCHPGDVALQAQDGEMAIEGHFDEEHEYFKGDDVFTYPPRPGEWAEFDLEKEVWIDPRGVAELEQERLVLLDKLNSFVAAQRRQFISDIPGQDMIYLRKEDEGRRYLALKVEPEDLSAFPMLAAEVGITAPTAYQLATIWVQLSAMWTNAAAQLETFRMKMDAAIQASTTFAELEEISNRLVAAGMDAN